MNKPDWNEAPEWANYLAMDEDGEWWWFEREPDLEEDCWDSGDKSSLASQSSRRWKDTLEGRHD